METIALNVFLKKATDGNSGYANAADWILGESGACTFNLDDNEKPVVGEVQRGEAVLGAVSLDIKTNTGEKYSKRVTPFNLSMLQCLKDKSTYTMKIPFVIEQRTSARGNKYQQILFAVEDK